MDKNATVFQLTPRRSTIRVDSEKKADDNMDRGRDESVERLQNAVLEVEMRVRNSELGVIDDTDFIVDEIKTMVEDVEQLRSVVDKNEEDSSAREARFRETICLLGNKILELESQIEQLRMDQYTGI